MTSRAAPAWRLEANLLLIESYRPVAPDGPVFDLVDSAGADVRVVGAVAIPGDEQVLYLVAAASVAAVEDWLRRTGLESIRIVPASWAVPTAEEGGA